MNTDIRIQMSFYSNTKIKKLRRMHGADAVLSLIYLWLYTAENRPHGELRGMDIEDIMVAAQWEGDDEQFMKTLLDLKFIDKKGSLYVVHDWKKNNPWAANAPERKKKAQQAARAKHAKKKTKQGCLEQVLADAPSPSPYHLLSLPSPSPSPNLSSSSSSEEEIATEAREATRAVTMTMKEFSKRYHDCFGVIMPPLLNNDANELTLRYPRDKINEAFNVTAEKGGKTFAYMKKVLEGVENVRGNGSNDRGYNPSGSAKTVGRKASGITEANPPDADWLGTGTGS